MVTIRERTEQIERETLSKYAALAVETRGRAVEEEKCPIRTDYQRDRDRIIHACKAFRRLSRKTQVFISPREDHYRTRLTHTLEVAQIAATIAKALRLNEELTEAIALGHDVGHTPFGHAGEWALDRQYRRWDPDAHFYHNEHSLRVVDVLEKDGKGLNLTFETRDGILKHSKGMRDLDESLTDDPPATLEGMVVRVADRIAYINHDIDDSIRAGIIQPEDLPADCVRILGDRHSARISTMVGDVVENSLDCPELRISPNIMRAMNDLKDFLFEHVYTGTSVAKREEKKVSGLIEALFTHYMTAADSLPGHPRIADLPTKERARLVCDYIAGMTDRFANDKYTELFLPRGWGTP